LKFAGSLLLVLTLPLQHLMANEPNHVIESKWVARFTPPSPVPQWELSYLVHLKGRPQRWYTAEEMEKIEKGVHKGLVRAFYTDYPDAPGGPGSARPQIPSGPNATPPN
jgi:hypothetical protein